MNPVIVVTGASKGIGLAVTRVLLHKFNANVVAISRNSSHRLRDLHSDSLLDLQCDVSDQSAFTAAISEAIARFHRLDALVLNAAVLEPLSRIGDDTPIDAWKSHFDTNFFSLLTALKVSLPSLRESAGRVVFVSSGAALKGTPGWGPYNASKAAMNSLCRTLAEEEPQVTSVSLRPGMVDTNMQETLRTIGSTGMNPSDHEFFINVHAQGKLVKPEDPGHVIAALAVHAEKSLSGQFINLHFALSSLRSLQSTAMAPNIRDILKDPRIRCIDVHHHYFPPDLNKAASNAKVGWKTPEGYLPWSPDISLRAMDALEIDFSILSFPAIASGTINEENRAAARSRNEYASRICDAHPQRFGFFATLPFLHDIEGCLNELSYAIDKLGACGVGLSSCYGEEASAKYIGHESFYPIWAELNKRSAVVFLHGAQIPSSTPFPHEFLGVLITEVPNETFKAAAHLVVTRHRRLFPDVEIILAHMGGTSLFLASRLAVLSRHMGCTLTPEEILADFKTFYYETALSAHSPNFMAAEEFVGNDRILFGTDIPAVSGEMAEWYTINLRKYYSDDAKLQRVMHHNAVRLLCKT